MGVTKLRFAPNRTASTKGSSGKPSSMAMLIAIGVPMTAAALFETMLVRMAINSISPERIPPRAHERRTQRKRSDNNENDLGAERIPCIAPAQAAGSKHGHDPKQGTCFDG
jgi:hypothetical protein